MVAQEDLGDCQNYDYILINLYSMTTWIALTHTIIRDTSGLIHNERGPCPNCLNSKADDVFLFLRFGWVLEYRLLNPLRRLLFFIDLR